MENNNENPKGTLGKIDKRIKILIAAVIAVALVTGIVNFAGWLADKNAYAEAEQLLQEQKYGSALKTLQPLIEKDYEDSKTLSKYIKAIQQLNKAEKSNIYEEYDSAESAFKALNGYRDSKQYLAYTDATRDLRYWAAASTSEFSALGEKFANAGTIKGSDSLAALFDNLANDKYKEAITCAQEYTSAGGTNLTSKEADLIANASLTGNIQNSEHKRIDTKLGLLSVACDIDKDMFDGIPDSTINSQYVKSFKIKGLGKAPNGKVLVVTERKPYKESKEYYVNLAYTAVFGKDRFPTSLQEVEYLIKLREKDTFHSWYSGGGKRVPAATQSMYGEIYDLKIRKTVAKTKTKKGPALKTRYSYGSIPSVITPNWSSKTKTQKKLIRQLVKKVPKAKAESESDI